jgi:uncharacterized protein
MNRLTCPLRLARAALALLALTLLAEGASWAQIKPSLTVMVPMRDGVHLATDVYLPAGAGPWPVALARTRFGKSDLEHDTLSYFAMMFPVHRLVENGVALVVQDVRGLGDSEGQARLLVDDGWGDRQDGADTVAWIRQQPWSNGKLATFGYSYLGSTQYALAGAGPEGIVGQHVAAGRIPYHYFFRNGVLLKAGVALFDPGFVAEHLRHPRYDTFWRGLDLGTRLDQVRWPIVHVTGWFDIALQDALDAFTQLQERGGEGARGRQHLLVGPWTHLAPFTREAGQLTFPENAVFPPGAPDTLQWLLFFLKGQQEIPANEPAVRYYVMGDVTDPQAPGNFWRAADRWPPPSQPLRLYFTAEGGLVPQAPAAPATREYDYDPTQPVPSVGGNEFEAVVPAGPRDQRPDVEGRPDVLVFTTPPLTEPLEVTGRISVHLSAASSARDTDFTARLTDVYPDGRSISVADGIVRARYRQSLEKEELITPGQRYAYDIDLWSTSLVFNRGHRIRVDISSSNAPRFEPNTNTGGPLPIDKNEKPVVAHQMITLGGPEASYITLPEVVGGGAP